MTRIALAIALTLATAVPALAQRIPLSELSAYLNGLRTAEADFTQINDDGSISIGTVYISRPGRARFEYSGSDEDLLVMAGGGQVAVFDGRSNASAEQYPLSETPLSIILAANVDLGQSNMVTAHSADDTSTRIVAQDPDRPEVGNIELVFTNAPIELRQWIITDDAGAVTTVILGEMETGGTLGARLFNIPQELAARGGD